MVKPTQTLENLPTDIQRYTDYTPDGTDDSTPAAPLESAYITYDPDRAKKPVIYRHPHESLNRLRIDEEVTAIGEENEKRMAEFSAAQTKVKILRGRMALWAARLSAEEYARKHMSELHELALAEDTQRDIDEWERPKDISEFTDDELVTAKEFIRLKEQWKKNNQDRLTQLLLPSGLVMQHGGSKYAHRVFEDDARNEIAMRMDLGDQYHRIYQACDALNSNLDSLSDQGQPDA